MRIEIFRRDRVFRLLEKKFIPESINVEFSAANTSVGSLLFTIKTRNRKEINKHFSNNNKSRYNGAAVITPKNVVTARSSVTEM